MRTKPTRQDLTTQRPYPRRRVMRRCVDLKTFGPETYRRYIGARLQPVLDTLQVMRRLGIWLEVTALVIAGINDDPAELEDAAGFVVEELGEETPWHISRFFPAYQMHGVPPTPVETFSRRHTL